MKKLAENKIRLPVFILLLFAICSTTSCFKQEASKAESLEENLTPKAENADIRTAQELIEKMPDAAMGYNKLAVAYIRHARETGDFSLNTKAETAVRRALEIDENNFEANKIKSSLLLTFHRFPEALELGTKLQQQYPKDAFFYGVLTDANVELGNYDEALENAQQMVDLRPDMSSYARVSHIRSLYGDSDGAIEAMITAARIADPKDKEAQAWCLTRLGEEYFRIGEYEKAEKQFDDALTILPNYNLALAAKGKARAAKGDYENAIKFYTNAQARVPLTETVIGLGNIYAKTGDSEKANKQYELAEVIEKSLGNTDQRRLALLWADQDQKLDAALEIAQTEYKIRKDIYTADILAWCLYKKGNFEEAKKAITEAMRLKTKDAQIFYHAGMIEKELGNKKAAAEFLQKALKLSPNFDVLQTEQAKTALAAL
jgi:tetratricopeptide (TPR) repeat protein